MTSAFTKFGCNTYSYTRSTRADDCIRHLVDLGFTEFEVMIHPGHLWPDATAPGTISSLRSILESNRARIVTLNTPNVDLNIASASETVRAYSLDLLETIIRFAGELGSAGVIVGPGKPNPLFPAPISSLLPHFYAALDRLSPVAKECSVQLWAENMPFSYLPRVDALVSALDEYGDPNIGIVFDFANAHFVSDDLTEAMQHAKPRLKLVHLCDTGRLTYRHDPVGIGDVPFAAFPGIVESLHLPWKPMLEIISLTPDKDLAISADRLAAMGY
jgi:L-ribulose-5-phosphate 3-epimerase